jgi:hypothetical protein
VENVENAKGEKRDRRADWEANHKLIRGVVLAFIQQLGRKPTHAEIVEKTQLHRRTVEGHMRRLRFEPQEHVLRVLTDDVILALANRARATGEPKAVELWMQIMEGWSRPDGEKGLEGTKVAPPKQPVYFLEKHEGVRGEDGGDGADRVKPAAVSGDEIDG